ncbi:MAG: hypothetical protein AAGK97_06860, partial [Bacteroidota bacterium]
MKLNTRLTNLSLYILIIGCCIACTSESAKQVQSKQSMMYDNEATSPKAKEVPKELTIHGDTRI